MLQILKIVAKKSRQAYFKGIPAVLRHTDTFQELAPSKSGTNHVFLYVSIWAQISGIGHMSLFWGGLEGSLDLADTKSPGSLNQ